MGVAAKGSSGAADGKAAEGADRYAVDAVFAPAFKLVLLRAVAIGKRRPTPKDGTLAQYRGGAPDTGDVHSRVRQCVQQRVVDRIEEIDPLDGLVLELARLGRPVERTNTGAGPPQVWGCKGRSGIFASVF
jgi:hypothetical protein